MYIQGHRFLVITNGFGSSTKRAIPIESIIQIIEFQDTNQTIIDYYCNEEKERTYAQESFESIMAGDHTVVL